MVSGADAVVDNFRPGVMKRLGIDDASLQEHNPDLVSVTGFGETGPARDRAAFDLVVQAYAGHLEITGHPEGAPARVGAPLADLAGGIYAAISVLAGLLGRELHGGGRHVDVAMLDSLVSLLTYDGLAHLNTGAPVTRQGTAHAHMVPWQAIEAKDGYIVIAARDEKFWQNLCSAIDRLDLRDDPRTADNQARLENRAFVVGVLEEAFMSRTKAEWMKTLDEFDIPAAPVNDMEAVFGDPQVRARGMVRSYEHATLGEVRYMPSPMKISDWEFPNLPAPMLGQHTLEILVERLGYEAEEVERLLAAGAVHGWR